MTTDIEQRLRDTLAAKAGTVRASDLEQPSLLPTVDMPVPPATRARRSFALAVAAVAIIAFGATALLARNESGSRVSSPLADNPGKAASGAGGRAWPLVNDEPLTPTIDGVDLRSPDSAARGYVTKVIGLSPDWRLEPAQIKGTTATVDYVLQDVPASISLEQDKQGLWFVTAAGTELASPGVPVSTPGGLDVSIGPGPRTYAGGVDVRVAAMGTDGAVIATKVDRVPSAAPRNAGAARVVALRWSGTEAPASVRIDVLSDHDANAATSDVVIGHWTAAVAPPFVNGLPIEVNLDASEPVFDAPGSPRQVAVAYMKDRFPDYPAPELTVGPALTRGARAWVDWSATDGIAGRLALRRTSDRWAVIAATTEGVDLRDLKVVGGRLRGRVTSVNTNSLFADVLRPDGSPVPGAPRPDGVQGATYRFGTAGGPSTNWLDLDVALDGPAQLRITLVGGTILSISEVTIAP